MLLWVFLRDPCWVFFRDPTLYADDSALYCSCKSANDLQDKLNLANVTNWMRSNKLTLNTAKSKFMLVGSRRRLGVLSGKDVHKHNTIGMHITLESLYLRQTVESNVLLCCS